MTTLPRMQTLLSGEITFGAFQNLSSLPVAHFIPNADPLVVRTVTEEIFGETRQVRYCGKSRLCTEATCHKFARHIGGYDLWGYMCVRCYKIEHKTEPAEQIVEGSINDALQSDGVEVQFHSNKKILAPNGEARTIYTYDWVSPTYQTDDTVVIFELDGHGSHHFNADSTDVPRIMETFQFVERVLGKKCILYRFYQGDGPEPSPEIAQCIRQLYMDRHDGLVPENSKVVLVEYPSEMRKREYTASFLGAVEHKSFGRDEEGVFTELFDSDHNAPIGEDLLTGE